MSYCLSLAKLFLTILVVCALMLAWSLEGCKKIQDGSHGVQVPEETLLIQYHTPNYRQLAVIFTDKTLLSREFGTEKTNSITRSLQIKIPPSAEAVVFNVRDAKRTDGYHHWLCGNGQIDQNVSIFAKHHGKIYSHRDVEILMEDTDPKFCLVILRFDRS